MLHPNRNGGSVSDAGALFRLTVIGGFLGAGKSTWLRHQIRGGVFQNAVILVNEAADSPVDEILLSDASRLAILAGGCACCVGRDRLIAVLSEMCARAEAQGLDDAKSDPLVLETSGLANPTAIVEAIRLDPFLSRRIRIGEVVVLVDALHGLGRLREESLCRTQVAAADCLIVTKVDAAEPEPIARLVATLKILNPQAPIFGSAHGVEVGLPSDDDVLPDALPEAASSGDHSVIFATTLEIDATIDWTTLEFWVSALLYARGSDVLRIKGVVRAPAGRILIQAVGGQSLAPVVLPDDLAAGSKARDSLVIIGRGYRAEDLKQSLRYFARAGRAASKAVERRSEFEDPGDLARAPADT